MKHFNISTDLFVNENFTAIANGYTTYPLKSERFPKHSFETLMKQRAKAWLAYNLLKELFNGKPDETGEYIKDTLFTYQQVREEMNVNEAVFKNLNNVMNLGSYGFTKPMGLLSNHEKIGMLYTSALIFNSAPVLFDSKGNVHTLRSLFEMTKQVALVTHFRVDVTPIYSEE